ncbi:MAG: nuclease-related domain-containing protein [Bulleidia sp.]|nr:NERD domain-containing protein [Erysipelotrichaceae bacterium]MDY2780143.1 nuclease-related domain-containing protein [Bulleidia sp.]
MNKKAVKQVFSLKCTKIIVGIFLFLSLWGTFDISYYTEIALYGYSASGTFSTEEKTQVVVTLAVIFLIYFYVCYKKEVKKLKAISDYQRSDYFKETGKTYEETVSNKGTYGEALTVEILSKCDGYKRILINAYIPKHDGTKSEIDAIMIHETGIYVFESKNYSGWIYGKEDQKQWVQVLNYGKMKNYFYNPIWQNKSHIENLKGFLGNLNTKFYSFIVFSQRCELKDVKYHYSNCAVVNRNNLPQVLYNLVGQSQKILTTNEIDDFYARLKPLTLITEEERKAHIESIKNKIGGSDL